MRLPRSTWLARRRIVRYCAFLADHADRLGYAEVRPMRSFETPYMTVPAHDTDCSESSAMILHASGVRVPWVKDGAGYTGTALATLGHIPLRKSRRGDLAVFVSDAHPDGVHMVILTQGGMFHSDPMVWSHGRPGVDRMPLSQMRAGFPGDHTVILRGVPS